MDMFKKFMKICDSNVEFSPWKSHIDEFWGTFQNISCT
jgi:hypothetical protein